MEPPPSVRVPAIGPTSRLVELAPLVLRDAADGRPPRRATHVRLGVRGASLVVRFDGRDEGWVATRTRRDDALWEEDVFEVFLTPEDPPARYYEFEVNPLGAVFDARIDSPRLTRPTICVDVGWDCPGFRARVRRTPERWSAALTIPLAAMAPEGIPARWRANFFRVDRAAPDELSAWSPVGSPPDFHRATRFGTLLLGEGALDS